MLSIIAHVKLTVEKSTRHRGDICWAFRRITTWRAYPMPQRWTLAIHTNERRSSNALLSCDNALSWLPSKRKAIDAVSSICEGANSPFRATDTRTRRRCSQTRRQAVDTRMNLHPSQALSRNISSTKSKQSSVNRLHALVVVEHSVRLRSPSSIIAPFDVFLPHETASSLSGSLFGRLSVSWCCWNWWFRYCCHNIVAYTGQYRTRQALIRRYLDYMERWMWHTYIHT